MFRRFVSMLAAVSFVASQLATIPHAHAEMTAIEKHEHDAHPHVHVGVSGHTHSHPQKGTSHDQQREHGHQAPLDPSVEHDADAIYLPAAGMAGTADPNLLGKSACG